MPKSLECCSFQSTLLSCTSRWHLHLCRETVITLVRARRTLMWQPLKPALWMRTQCEVTWQSHAEIHQSLSTFFFDLPLCWRRKLAIKNTNIWLRRQKDCLWFKGCVHELCSSKNVSALTRSDTGIFKRPDSSSAQSCFPCCFVAESFWQCEEQCLNTTIWQSAKLLSYTSHFSSLSNAKAEQPEKQL